MENKELRILKWLGIALAALSTIFTLVLVASHLTGRLIGLGRVGILGSVGAELVVIFSAHLAASERKLVAGVAMLCQIVLTGLLLVNASIALDLSWQETLADKASERSQTAQRVAADEQRKTEKERAEVAASLAQTDKRLAREFVRAGGKLSAPPSLPAQTQPSDATDAPVDVRKLTAYERYGLTVAPLFLALLCVIALALAAHSGSHQDVAPSQPDRPPVDFAPRRPMVRTVSARHREEDSHEKLTTPPKTKTQVSSIIEDTNPAQKDTVSLSSDTREGLKRLREVLKTISFYLPGKSFKADVKEDCLWIRLMIAEHGIQRTEASAKAKLELLSDVLTMPAETFRARLEKFLKSKGFDL